MTATSVEGMFLRFNVFLLVQQISSQLAKSVTAYLCGSPDEERVHQIHILFFWNLTGCPLRRAAGCPGLQKILQIPSP